jgi:hypothetical protein
VVGDSVQLPQTLRYRKAVQKAFDALRASLVLGSVAPSPAP